MMELLQIIAALGAVIAALFAILLFFRRPVILPGALTKEQAIPLLRHETDVVRRSGEEQGRGLRQELLTAFAGLRDELGSNFQRLGTRVLESLGQMGEQQKERLDNSAKALASLGGKLEAAQESLKSSVEHRLDAIRLESANKLDEMRQTVDEKLQTTLENRLGESFNRVVEHLERVHKGIGEMQTLAANVGDLRNVLTNVKVRGTYGEVQLELLLEQFLAREQYVKNAQTREGSGERVEFAVRLPGKGEGHEVLLPVDSKFPREDYEKLVAASDAGDGELIALFRRQLETRIKACARDIKDKYLNPPRTTDFGILFVPTESLYAEVLRQPGLFETLQRDCHVTIASPTTLAALLNALQMGFRSLAIERRSSEVWQILGAVRTEFSRYNAVVDTLSKQLTTAANSVESLGRRTRVMSKRLKDVETLPADGAAQTLLGIGVEDSALEDDDAETLVPEANGLPRVAARANGL